MDKIILLVEDDPGDVELTKRALRKASITNKVVVAGNGAEALDFLFAGGKYAGRNAEETPYVVILDLKLPKIDGLEVLQRMRADPRTRPVPVVILSSHANGQKISNGYSLGIVSYLKKPIDPQQLTEIVRQLNVHWMVVGSKK